MITTLKEVLYKRDDAIMEILDRMKGKKLYNNLWVQLRFFWQETKRAVYCATPWKDAQGDDLPEYDREVIAIINNGKVAFAHRPNPNGWDGKSLSTGKVEHYTPKTYDKGGWNITDVKWWLDCSLPNMED
jgi:hypothetical protein